MASLQESPKQKSKNKNLIVLIVIGAILVLLIAIVYIVRMNQNGMPSKVTVNGTLVCLPHKNPGDVETLECVTGLKTDDNQHYGLTNLPDDSPANEINGRVQIKGDVTTPPADYNYDAVGIIKVETINEE